MSHDRADWAAGKFQPGDPHEALAKVCLGNYSLRVGRATRGKSTDLLETQRADALVEREGEAAMCMDIAAAHYVAKRRLSGKAHKPWYDEALGCWRTDRPRPVASGSADPRQLHTALQILVQKSAERRFR